MNKVFSYHSIINVFDLIINFHFSIKNLNQFYSVSKSFWENLNISRKKSRIKNIFCSSVVKAKVYFNYFKKYFHLKKYKQKILVFQIVKSHFKNLGTIHALPWQV